MSRRKTGSVSMVAVKDVEKTSKLLANLFDWQSTHGGPHVDILVTEKKAPALMLHEFNESDHKRFNGIKKKAKGIGQTVYMFVGDIDGVYRKVKRRKLKIVEPLWLNENNDMWEFTFQIAEGYQFTACEGDGWLY